jgi:hypothetical protein
LTDGLSLAIEEKPELGWVVPLSHPINEKAPRVAGLRIWPGGRSIFDRPESRVMAYKRDGRLILLTGRNGHLINNQTESDFVHGVANVVN